jgi:hypothetical protein
VDRERSGLSTARAGDRRLGGGDPRSDRAAKAVAEQEHSVGRNGGVLL